MVQSPPEYEAVNRGGSWWDDAVTDGLLSGLDLSVPLKPCVLIGRESGRHVGHGHKHLLVDWPTDGLIAR